MARRQEGHHDLLVKGFVSVSSQKFSFEGLRA